VALLVSALLVAPTASAQVLSLVVEQRGEESAFWWRDPGVAEPTRLDELLAERMSASGPAESVVPVSLIDPAAETEIGVSISRVYRVASLSLTNARNLGGFYGAQVVLLGEADITPASPVAGRIAWVAELRLSFTVAAVEVDAVHLTEERLLVADGPDPESAELAVRRQAADVLASAIAATVHREAGLERPPTSGPTVVVVDLERAAPLVAFEGDLRRYGEVVADVHEVWAREGEVGVEIELVPGATADDFQALLGQLAFEPSEAYRLEIGQRLGQAVEVRLIPPPAPAPSAPFE
jgi:hypothetical protein